MKAYQELVQSLDQLVTVYRHLLDIVRKENEILIKADMKQIPDMNLTKEKLVFKVKELDGQWQIAATNIAIELQLNNRNPTLLEIASQFSGENATKLEQQHSVLNILVSRIAELNKKNEILVNSVLSHINGAMNSITNTLNENPTYKNSGSMEKINNDAQGRLVQREA
jgi:flagellar biosynthesis/type III secretory pathway chaperone